MFTGIIEDLGEVVLLERVQNNLHITCKSIITQDLKIDQSLSHNGVCLTVMNIDKDRYTVIAVNETLNKTNLGDLKVGDKVNLERSVKVGDRFDGHIVQGHVDQKAICKSIQEDKGSWIFTFEDYLFKNLIVEKGSICINGVSLTVIDLKDDCFSVSIIPYTFENTNFHNIDCGTLVNIEFDIFGKYIQNIFMKS